MKNLISFLLILCTLNVSSQERHADGDYKKYHKNGQLEKEGFYKNDKKIGGWKDYYDNGQLKKMYLFDNDGFSTGIHKTYSKDGKLISETKRSQKGGLISKHYFENGKLQTVYALIPSEDKKSFVKSGGYKEFYASDTLKIESLYINNELHGVWKQYYETGKIAWEVEYNNGAKQGFYKQYYENGILKLEGQHEADLKNGEEKRYNDSGNLLWKGTYLNDDFDAAWTQYDAMGNPINVLNFNKGKLKKSKIDVDLKVTEIPDGYFERVPVYPGCENFPGNKKKRDCMSKKIQEFVSSTFNTNVASETGITGKTRINITFEIDTEGKVTDIRARAPHPKLEAEAIDVIRKLPIMKPGMQNGKMVTVLYSLPIVFSVQENQTPTTTYAITDEVLERVPVYPGCEMFPGNQEKRDCMSKKIKEFVSSKYDTRVANELAFSGIQRIIITFKIDAEGKVTDIKAVAPHPILEAEAIDAVSKLPIMKPGIVNGKKVTVLYALPIVFHVE